jgi:tyrosyl-tRNA synthetase
MVKSDKEERIRKIVKDTEEVVAQEELLNLFEEVGTPKSYWGIAPTGPPHIGYYRAIAKQRDFINAGLEHKILIADLHAYLDDRKAPLDEVESRGKIYEVSLRMLGLDKNVEYLYGSSFQKSEKYVEKLLEIMPLVTVKRATRAASTVCRMKNPKVSELVYPLMQNLDFWALDVDIAYGGIDQRHVYMMGREILQKMELKIPILIFTPLGLSLTGKEKMSASKKKGRLELYAPPDEVYKKIHSAYCPLKEIEANPVVDYAKYLIFPRIGEFVIEREEKHGGDISFTKYEDLERAYLRGEIHPLDFKKATATYLISIFEPIRKYFGRHEDMLAVFKEENEK